MHLRKMSPTNIIKKYNTDDIITIAKSIGFKVKTGSVKLQNVMCFLISDKKSCKKEIIIDEFQSSEWIYFEVAFLISWYILRGNNNTFSIKLDYKDFFKEENKDVFDYSCELLLYNTYIKNDLSYVNSKEKFEEIKEEAKVPDFILRNKLGK